MFKHVSIRTKLLVLLIVPIGVITITAIIISSLNIRNQGKRGLEEKSSAVLSRMEAVRSYIANQGGMERKINELTKQYPRGNIPQSEKELLKKRVPIIASWMIGEKNAEQDNYTFRIASESPRNNKHKATPKEQNFLQTFKSQNKESITHINEETNELWVMRPVYLSEEQNCLKCHGDPAKSPYNNGKDILGYQMEDWEDDYLQGMFVIKSDLGPVQEQANSAIFSISTWGVGIAIVAVVLGLVIVRLIVRSVRKIRNISRHVVDGDLTHAVDIRSGDELEDLGQSINEMTEAFNRILSRIAQFSSYLATATNEISQSSNTISNGAQNQAAQFEELTSSIHNTTQSAQNSQETARNITENAKTAGKSVDETRDSIHEIESRSNKIKEAVDVISDIAKETNILALNASVEAARAGEYGKGFGVVAREVQRLAENSSKAAQDIKGVIMEAVELISDGAEKSEVASKRINEIIQQIETSSAEMKNIAQAAKEQSEGMDKNSDITNNNAASAEQLETSARNIAEQAKQLDELIALYKFEGNE